MRARRFLPFLASIILVAGVCAVATLVDEPTEWPIEVHRTSPLMCGEKSSESLRAMVENVIDDEEIDWMKALAKKGMSVIKNQNGPTIMSPDLNMAFGPGGQFSKLSEVFTESEMLRYNTLYNRIYEKVIEVHNLPANTLFHTAPTFIAKLEPFSTDQKPEHVHDEYWHSHCDKNNTEHYDYSALVYLSDYEKDFEGGLFLFEEEGNKTISVKPKRGTLLTFVSGWENPHKIARVTHGERMAWSLWFTCNPQFRKDRISIVKQHEGL